MKKTKKLVMSWLLAFCCVITLVAPSVVNAAADDFEIIDDTDARFVYSDGNANNRCVFPVGCQPSQIVVSI